MALKDRNGIVTTYTYDNMNRMLNKTATVSAGETEYVTYTYDTLGNVSTMVDATGTTTYTYNAYNLLSSIITPDNNSISYSYNNLKQLAGVLNYDDEYIEYTYDLMGNVSTISIDDEVVAEYTYNDKNMLSEVNYPGEGSTTYGYDWHLRLNSLTNKLADESIINSYAYTYDNAGNQTRKTETVGTQTKITNYTYDDLNRLSSYTAPDGTVTTYTFDTRNNITRESITHPTGYEFTYSYYGDDYELDIWDVTNHTIDYTYDSANKLLTETESLVGESWDTDGTFNGTNTYSYDLNGNMIAKDASGDYDTSIEYDYSFDAFNRLKSIHEEWIYYYDESITTRDYVYEYNGNNELVTTTSAYDGELSNTNCYYWDRSYIVKNNGVNYYLGVDGVFAQSSGTNISYLLKNAHGDTVKVLCNGAVVGSEDYDAYGNDTDWNSYSAYKYANYYYDSNSGFYYLRNRFYDPSIGRFVSEDPVHDGMNWYAYANNNPVMFVDPLGLAPGDLFSTPEEAAADFGFCIGQKSIDIEEEFFSFIRSKYDKYGNKCYYYDTPRNDYETHDERNRGFHFKTFSKSAIAVVHTHGSYDANGNNTKDGFSTPGDALDPQYSDTAESDRLGVDYYVVTPAGNLYKYESNSGNSNGILIRSDMPVDSRIELHQHMENTFLWRLLISNFPNGKPQDFVNARLKYPDSIPNTLKALERYR